MTSPQLEPMVVQRNFFVLPNHLFKPLLMNIYISLLFNDKNVKKKGRVQHLPDSCQTSQEQREPGEKIKYKELLEQCGFHHETTYTQ